MAFVSLCGNLEPSLHPRPYSHSSHLGSRSSLRVTSCPCWPGIAGGERGSWNAELPMLKLGKSLANQDGWVPLSSILPTSPRIQLVPLSDLFSTEQPGRSANLVMSLPCWKAFEWPPSIIKAKPFNPASEVFYDSALLSPWLPRSSLLASTPYPPGSSELHCQFSHTRFHSPCVRYTFPPRTFFTHAGPPNQHSSPPL